MKCILNIILLFVTLSLYSQKEEVLNPEIEVNVSILNSPSLIIERNYPVGKNETDISSSNSPGYSFSLRYLKNQKKLNWVIGFDMGLYSIKTYLHITDEFRYLGWGGYFDKSVSYPITYIGTEVGVKYNIFEKSKNKLTATGTILAAYHIRKFAEFTQSAILDNGSFKPLYYGDFLSNDNNKIIIAPKIDFKYQYKLKKGEIFIGLTSTISNKTPFTGVYEIYGDREILSGVLKKQFLLGGISVGYIKPLK